MDGSSKGGLEERYDFARDLARQVGREALRFWVVSDGCEPVSARAVTLSLMAHKVDAIQQERRHG